MPASISKIERTEGGYGFTLEAGDGVPVAKLVYRDEFLARQAAKLFQAALILASDAMVRS